MVVDSIVIDWRQVEASNLVDYPVETPKEGSIDPISLTISKGSILIKPEEAFNSLILEVFSSKIGFLNDDVVWLEQTTSRLLTL